MESSDRVNSARLKIQKAESERDGEYTRQISFIGGMLERKYAHMIQREKRSILLMEGNIFTVLVETNMRWLRGALAGFYSKLFPGANVQGTGEKK